MLGIDWSRAEAPKILETVQEIQHLTIKKKVPLDEAVERLRKTGNKALSLAATPNPKLLNAWEKHEKHKVNVVENVTQATWNQEYGGRPNHAILPPRNKSKESIKWLLNADSNVLSKLHWNQVKALHSDMNSKSLE